MEALVTLLQAHPPLAIGFAALFGLLVGSFLNVIILRLPRILNQKWSEECYEFLQVENPTLKGSKIQFNLCFPGSHCLHCQTSIRWFDNLPIIGFCLLKGHCRACQAPISIQYPLVEALTAILFMIVIWRLGITWQGLFACLLTSVLITQSAIDMYHTYIPDDITLPMLWLGIILGIFGIFKPLDQVIIGAIAGYMSLWSFYWLFKLLTSKEGMGYGDFKLLAMLGAWQGWQNLPLIVITSSLVGTIFGIAFLILKNKDKNYRIPFGPYLAIAGWIALLWGDSINQYYLNYVGFL